MPAHKYTGYIAQIHGADDASTAAAKGEAMIEAFPGAEYEVVPGNPCGLCSHVDGPDARIQELIRNWINSR